MTTPLLREDSNYISDDVLLVHFNRLFDLNGASISLDRIAPGVIRATGSTAPGVRLYGNGVKSNNALSWICTKDISIDQATVASLHQEIRELEVNTDQNTKTHQDIERLRSLRRLLHERKQPVTLIYQMED